jgi:hypothetical protein
MILKPEVVSRVAGIVGQIEQRADKLPAQMREARETLAAWGVRARRFTRKNPGTVLIGAFALGVVLARAAHHA